MLNTIDDLADAGNWVCAQHGWPEFTVEQFKHMVGNGIPKLVERFSPADARTPEQLAATLAEFTARYDAHKEDKTAPYPGIAALIDALNTAGVQCAVFSNKADPLCGKIIEHYFAGLPVIKDRQRWQTADLFQRALLARRGRSMSIRNIRGNLPICLKKTGYPVKRSAFTVRWQG